MVDALGAAVKTALQSVPVSDNSYVSVVRFGRLQDNPLKGQNGIYALVHLGNPFNAEWKDHSASELRSGPIEIGSGREVGGASRWWRAFSVEWALFLIKQRTDREASRDLAALIEARIQKAVATASFSGLIDDFGENATQAYDMTAEMDEGGGPPTSFIWRGVVQLYVLTGRPF